MQFGHEPVVRTHREEEADVLVGDRPGPEVGVPGRDGALDETPRVQVQVVLGVGGDPARAG